MIEIRKPNSIVYKMQKKSDTKYPQLPFSSSSAPISHPTPLANTELACLDTSELGDRPVLLALRPLRVEETSSSRNLPLIENGRFAATPAIRLNVLDAIAAAASDDKGALGIDSRCELNDGKRADENPGTSLLPLPPFFVRVPLGSRDRRAWDA